MVDPRDQQSQNHGKGPETIIALPSGDEVHGLYIAGWREHAILGVRVDRDGVPLSCAVVNSIALDCRAQNPRRYPKAWRIDGTDEE